MSAPETVLRAWRVGARKVAKPDLGTMNEMFLVDTDNGRLVLRGHRHPDRAAVEFEHDVMQIVRSADVPAPEALATPTGDRIVGHDGRWWSLLRWIDGDQPARGSHTRSQAEAMGEMLARIHLTLRSVQPMSTQPAAVESTAATIRRGGEIISFIEALPNPGLDEDAALRWLQGQRDWLGTRGDEAAPPVADGQTVHGDYHDANVVFRADAVAGVLDWDSAGLGDPLKEVIRAMHLSFRLEPSRCRAFVTGYRSCGSASPQALDAAAARYAFHRDRSVWFFDELYRRGNERLRPLINRSPFTPFQASWDSMRGHLRPRPIDR